MMNDAIPYIACQFSWSNQLLSRGTELVREDEPERDRAASLSPFPARSNQRSTRTFDSKDRTSRAQICKRINR